MTFLLVLKTMFIGLVELAGQVPPEFLTHSFPITILSMLAISSKFWKGLISVYRRNSETWRPVVDMVGSRDVGVLVLVFVIEEAESWVGVIPPMV